MVTQHLKVVTNISRLQDPWSPLMLPVYALRASEFRPFLMWMEIVKNRLKPNKRMEHQKWRWCKIRIYLYFRLHLHVFQSLPSRKLFLNFTSHLQWENLLECIKLSWFDQSGTIIIWTCCILHFIIFFWSRRHFFSYVSPLKISEWNHFSALISI